jgi:Tol biopolymer transport system component
MVADLEILRIDDGQAEPILRAQVHQGSPLSWFPDGDRIALQSPDDQVLIVDRNSKHMERVAEGQAPVVSPDGSRIAFKRSGAVFVLELSPGNTQRVDTGRAAPSTELAWSPDGRCLTYGTTAGLTGKETRFHLYDLEASRDHKLPLRYMTGLTPV